MVIPPAKTGKDNNSNVDATTIDQGNSTIRSPRIPHTGIFLQLVIKLIDAPIDDTPAK